MSHWRFHDLLELSGLGELMEEDIAFVCQPTQAGVRRMVMRHCFLMIIRVLKFAKGTSDSAVKSVEMFQHQLCWLQ